MINLEIREKLNDAQEAAAKAELILAETFDRYAINENISDEEIMNIFRPEAVDDPENGRIISWIFSSGQISRKLEIATDYLTTSIEIMQNIEESMRNCKDP